jgi:hypothetical protein
MTPRSSALIAALVVALALPLLAAPATTHAKPTRYVSYVVTVEGEAEYERIGARRPGFSHSDYEAKWTWRTVFPSVLFHDDRAFTEGPDNLAAMTTATIQSAKGTTTNSWGTHSCSTTGLTRPAGSGRFFDTPYVRGTDPLIRMHLLGGLLPDFDGCPSQALASFDLLGKFVDGKQTYETQFEFPREAIGMGQVIQLVHEDVADRRCPRNLVAGESQSCRLTLDAKVIFVKRNDFVVDDSEPVEIRPEDIPSPPPATPAAPQRSAAPAPGQVLVAPLRTGAAKLAASGASATVPVTCAAACSGTVTASAASGGAKARAAASRVLASKRFKVSGGRAARVTVRFSRAARRAIRRAGGVRLAVRATSPGRPPLRDVVTVRLPRR